MENLKSIKKGAYTKLMDDDGARIGRYACKNGVDAAARHFSKILHLERPLNASTVRGIKRVYLKELTRKRT